MQPKNRHSESMKRALVAGVVCICAVGATPVVRGWLGMGYNAHRNSDGSQWLNVERVAPGGPAAVAGLRPFDVVTAINGKPIAYRTNLALVEAMSGFPPGHKVRLDVSRGTTKLNLVLVSVRMPDEYVARYEATLELARARDARQQH